MIALRLVCTTGSVFPPVPSWQPFLALKMNQLELKHLSGRCWSSCFHTLSRSHLGFSEVNKVESPGTPCHTALVKVAEEAIAWCY